MAWFPMTSKRDNNIVGREVTPRAPVKFCVVDGASTAYYSLTHAAIAPLQTAQI